MGEYKSFSKEPYEEYDITVDFERTMRPSAIIASIETGYPKATKTTEGDMTSTVLGASSTPSPSGTIVTTRVKAGSDGDRIKIEWRIIDNNGEKYEGGIWMEVANK